MNTMTQYLPIFRHKKAINNILFDYQKQTLRQQVSIGLIQFI